MTIVDVWAVSALSIGGSAVAVRARMLRPHQEAWTHAPAVVWGGLSLLGLALLMSAASIAFGAHASPREAMVYTVLACVSVIMLWNLNRHGRMAAVLRRRFAEEAKMALEFTPPPARYRGERFPR